MLQYLLIINHLSWYSQIYFSKWLFFLWVLGSTGWIGSDAGGHPALPVNCALLFMAAATNYTQNLMSTKS